MSLQDNIFDLKGEFFCTCEIYIFNILFFHDCCHDNNAKLFNIEKPFCVMLRYCISFTCITLL